MRARRHPMSRQEFLDKVGQLRHPMSRQEFLDKVGPLLGAFDSDSFMHGFNSGVDRSCDLIRDWVVKEMPMSVFRNQLLRRIREVKSEALDGRQLQSVLRGD